MEMRLKYILVCFFMVHSLQQGLGQERFGLSTTKYGGMDYISYNPALALSSGYQIAIGIGTAGGTIDNHLVSFKNYSEAFNSLFDDDTNSTRFKFNLINSRNASLYADYLYRSPSLTVKGEKMAVGFALNNRFAITLDRFPTRLINDICSGFDPSLVGQKVSLSKGGFSGLSWKEAMLNYSFRYDKHLDREINVGFNLKYIYESEAVTQIAKDNLVYEYINDSTIYIDSHSRSSAWGFGKGASFDIGSTFIKYETDDKKRGDYKYLFGIAFVDVGKIIYNEGMVYNYKVDHQYLNTVKQENRDSMLSELFYAFNMTQFYPQGGFYVNTWTASKKPFPSSFFHVQLPTIGRAHLDLKLMDNFYLNTDISYGFISRNSPYIRKPTQINFTPRYQSPKFDFLLPVSVTDFNQVRIGAAMRIGSVQFGTDRLKTFSKDVKGIKGFDVYLSAKIGVEEIEKTILKPYKKGRARVEFADNGYTNSISYFPGENMRVYCNQDPKIVTQLSLKNLKGDVLHTLPVTPLLQPMQNFKPWKHGYGYRISAAYDIPKNLESGIYKLGENISFVVKPPIGTTPRVLVVVPSVNYTAMNKGGGKSLNYSGSKKHVAKTVSFYRPLPQENFTNLTKLVSWLNENCNASLGYITERELEEYDNIKDADILLIAGNLLYTTAKAKENYEKFMWSGKSAIVLSNSFMNYRINYKWDNKQVSVDKGGVKRYTLKSQGNRSLGPQYPIPALESHSASIASSSSLMNMGTISDAGFKIVNAKNLEATSILLKQSGYNPEELGVILQPDLNNGKPVYIIKQSPRYGYAFYFNSDDLLKFSSPKDAELLKAIFSTVIR